MSADGGDTVDVKTVKHLKILFSAMFTMGLFVNFDSGAVPVRRGAASRPMRDLFPPPPPGPGTAVAGAHVRTPPLTLSS